MPPVSPGRILLRIPTALLLSTVLIALLVGVAAGPSFPAPREASGTAPALGRHSDQGATPARPNIVEVLADDMRVDDLQYAPNLRKLVAADGIAMQNAFSSYPLCCPARASFLSGMLPHNHHVYDVNAPYGYRAFDDRRTLATAVKAVGYNTGFMGKYLNDYGADEALAPKLTWQARHPGRSLRRAPKVQSQYYVPAGWDQWRASIDGVFCRPACGDTYNYFHYGFSSNGRPTAAPAGAYSSDVIGRQSVRIARSFHRKRERTGRPFLMSVNYVAPHQGSGQGDLRARNPDGSVSRLKTPAAPAWAYRVPMIRRIAKGAGITVRGVGESDVSDKPGSFADLRPLTAAEQRIQTELTRRRAAAVYVMDRNIGRLVRQLKASGEWDRTVFVFWSDNGYFQGEHNRMSGKILAYEPSLRVPMLITGPGMRGGNHDGLLGGQDRFDPIDVVDLTRTLLDVAGATPPHAPDGASLVPVLRGGDAGWTTAVPYEAAMANPSRDSRYRDSDFPRGARNRRGTLVGVRDGVEDPRTAIGVRTGRWLYVRYVAGDAEVYDLRTDPLEWSNLASDRRWMSDHADLLADLETAWKQVRYCVGATCRPRLPSSLAAGAAENRTEGRRYWRTVAATYGWSGVLGG